MQADHKRMADIAGPRPTKAAKIRALARAGFARADIARFLGIRYQHVRNVLAQQPPASERAELPPQDDTKASGFAESTAEWSVEVARDNLEVSADGTVRVPKSLLILAEIQPGETILARVVDGEVRLSSYAATVRRVQWLAKHFVRPGASEVDDFIAERRAAGARGD
jgi:hypothetical protein